MRALQTLRGVELIVATTFATEIGDPRRFENPRPLMAYLGLVPSEQSTGDTIRRGRITKAGNGRVRHMLVESAWSYRHPPKIGRAKLYRLGAVTPKVREIAWEVEPSPVHLERNVESARQLDSRVDDLLPWAYRPAVAASDVA